MLKKIGKLAGVLALLLPGVGWAECTEKGAIEAYLAAKQPGFFGLVLTSNHTEVDAQKRWKAWDCGGCTCELIKRGRDFKVDHTGKPSWSLDTERKFLVLVTDTNPLIFGTEFVESKDEDIEGLADLQKFAGLIGGFATNWVAKTADRSPGRTQRNKETGQEVSFMSIQPRIENLFIDSKDEPLLALIENINHLADCLARPESNACSDVPSLEHVSANVRTAVENAKPPVAALQKLGAKIEVGGSDLASYLQTIEFGTQPSKLLKDRDFGTLIPSLDAGFAALLDTRGKLADATLLCEDGVAGLGEAAETLLRQPCHDCLDLTNASARLLVIREELTTQNLAASECKDLTSPLVRLIGHLIEVDQLPQPSRDLAVESVRRKLGVLVGATAEYGRHGTQRAKALKGISDTIADRSMVTKSAARLQHMAQVEAAALDNNSDASCALTHGVIPVHRGEGSGLDIPWSKKRTEQFKIKLDPAFEEQIVLLHPSTVDASYTLEAQRRFDFGVDAGLVYTRLVQPKWTAVEADDPASEKPEDTIMVIDANGSDSRAGEVALFLDLEPRRRQWSEALRWGLQIGAGTDTSHPSLFVGAKLQWRFLRFGVGATVQQVQELDGKKLGDQVEDADSIPLRDTFSAKPYVSLTIAIDDLPFWNAGGDE